VDAYIPELITLHALATVFIASIVISLATTIIISIIEIIKFWPIFIGIRILSTWYKLFFFTFPISLIAYIAGYLSTMNRTAAVGTVLPAILALIGGLNIYVFGADTKYRNLVVTVCVFCQ
jgi:hypothetical protein